jgi:hypothetical protein
MADLLWNAILEDLHFFRAEVPNNVGFLIAHDEVE